MAKRKWDDDGGSEHHPETEKLEELLSQLTFHAHLSDGMTLTISHIDVCDEWTVLERFVTFSDWQGTMDRILQSARAYHASNCLRIELNHDYGLDLIMNNKRLSSGGLRYDKQPELSWVYNFTIPMSERPDISAPLPATMSAAIRDENIKVVEQLLREGASVNAWYNGWSHLQLSVRWRNIDILKLLLRQPNIIVKDEESVHTVMSLAIDADCGGFEITELLLQAGASPIASSIGDITILHHYDCRRHGDKADAFLSMCHRLGLDYLSMVRDDCNTLPGDTWKELDTTRKRFLTALDVCIMNVISVPPLVRVIIDYL